MHFGISDHTHSMATRVAIVGTAGRTAQQLKWLSSGAMELMKTRVLVQLREWGLQPERVVLVSGGSAWADHVAVQLFLEHPGVFAGLHLHLPCQFRRDRLDFHGNACAARLNYLHLEQSDCLKINTHDELRRALDRGATFDVDAAGDFHARNTRVARSEYLLAFTFSPGGAPSRRENPGTTDMWQKCAGVKVHVSLPRPA